MLLAPSSYPTANLPCVHILGGQASREQSKMSTNEAFERESQLIKPSAQGVNEPGFSRLHAWGGNGGVAGVGSSRRR